MEWWIAVLNERLGTGQGLAVSDDEVPRASTGAPIRTEVRLCTDGRKLDGTVPVFNLYDGSVRCRIVREPPEWLVTFAGREDAAYVDLAVGEACMLQLSHIGNAVPRETSLALTLSFAGGSGGERVREERIVEVALQVHFDARAWLERFQSAFSDACVKAKRVGNVDPQSVADAVRSALARFLSHDHVVRRGHSDLPWLPDREFIAGVVAILNEQYLQSMGLTLYRLCVKRGSTLRMPDDVPARFGHDAVYRVAVAMATELTHWSDSPVRLQAPELNALYADLKHRGTEMEVVERSLAGTRHHRGFLSVDANQDEALQVLWISEIGISQAEECTPAMGYLY